MGFLARLKENGFSVTEELLHALNGVGTDVLEAITEVINDVMGVNLNWASLVKGWDVPTGESYLEHLYTFIVNFLGADESTPGTRLPCGHFIPENTFILERYNGCPYCGTPFETADFVYTGQGSKLKELRLLTEADLRAIFNSLLASPTPLDATQRESLQALLEYFPLDPNQEIKMKETAMLVIDLLLKSGKEDEAARLMKTPTDILRYLWYVKTGHAQIIRPRTLIANARKTVSPRELYDFNTPLRSDVKRRQLRLKYNRRECLRVARWLNSLPMSADKAAEIMHPYRQMWVRMIRALRLGEYSRKPGFEHLAEILDVFYNETYTVWQGSVDTARAAGDKDRMLTLLKERPGVFARCLFATMLRFGATPVLEAFDEISDKLPARLLISLGNAAEVYFTSSVPRLVSTITGRKVQIPYNPLLEEYSPEERREMVEAVENLYVKSMKRRFAASASGLPSEKGRTIYIAPELYDIPVSVGDRSATIQDTSCALQGTRFPIEGNDVRLFLQWGKGLPAQHLDMDISCRIIKKDGSAETCAYYSLVCTGAKHSGDIQRIPDMVGTAEYIELTLSELEEGGAEYVVFVCNAYSGGALSPNLVVGWMNSAYPMEVSDETGVAYDPSCVQHFVRISADDLSKGLVFGVLEVEKRQIIWLEMPFMSRSIYGLDHTMVRSLLERLSRKLSIGRLLEMKADAQGLTRTATPESATESYTYEWALNPSAVASLLSGD